MIKTEFSRLSELHSGKSIGKSEDPSAAQASPLISDMKVRGRKEQIQ
jgi:hypothetical protein